MKFLCGGCRTKYQISDEKLRGKVLTIRCKKCSAKIVVRESMLREGGGTVVAPVAEDERVHEVEMKQRSMAGGAKVGGSAALASAFDVAMSSSDSDSDDIATSIAPTPSNRDDAGIEWYVAIDGHQSGPFAFAELVRKIRAKDVLGRHYVWHDGMGSWTRVREVDDLVSYIGADKRKPPPPPPSTQGERLGHAAGGAEVVDFASKRAELEHKRNGPDGAFLQDAEQHASVLSVTLHEAPTEAKLGAHGSSSREEQLDHVLNEALGIEGEDATMRAAANRAVAHATTAKAETSGAVAEPSLESLLAFDSNIPDDLFANVPRATESEKVKRESTRFFVVAAGVTRQMQKNRLAVIMGSVAVSAVLAFLVAWAVGTIEVSLPGIGNPFARSAGGDDDSDAVPEDLSQEDARALKEMLDPELRKQFIRGVRARAAARPSRAARPGAAGYITDQQTTRSRTARGDDERATIPLGTQGTSGAPDLLPSASLPEADLSNIPVVERATLDQNVIQQVVNERKRSVLICYQQSLRGDEELRGKLEVVVTVEPSGAVSRALVDTAKFKGSKVGNCIMDKIKDWRFPPFAGQAQTVMVPFLLEKSY